MPDGVTPDNGADFGAQMAARTAAMTPPAPVAPTPAAAAPTTAPTEQPYQNPDADVEKLKSESWGNKVYHGVLSALGGQYDTQFIPTENGVVKAQVANTPGQQWKRIISGALTGYAGAAAAGTQGPGGIARGLGGGIQAGYGERIREGEQQEKTANTQFEQQQKAAMDTAQKSLMASQVAKSTFELSAQKKQSYEADLTNEANLEKMYQDSKDIGGRDLGVMPTFKDVIDKFNNDPTLHDSHAQGQIIPIPHVNAKGEIDGVHAIWVPKAWQDAKATEDYTYQYLTGYDDKGKPQFQPMTIGRSTGATNGAVQDAKLGNANRLLEFHSKEVEADTKQQMADIAAKKAPAEMARDWATAEDERAQASDRLFASGDTPQSQQVIDAIGTGHVTVQRLGQLLSKPEGQKLLANVMAKYPDFDQSKVSGYIHAVQDFTDTKLGTAGGNLRTVGGAMKQLKKVSDLNTTASLMPRSEANTAYKTMVHNVAPEIAKFYGTSTKEGIEKIEDELLSMTPGNRRAAIETQAQAIGDVIDTYDQSWRNAAPSPRYEAPMPGLDQNAIDARAALDPQYAARQKSMPGGGQAAPPPTPGGAAAQPGVAYDAQGNKYTKNTTGQYVDAQGKPYRY